MDSDRCDPGMSRDCGLQFQARHVLTAASEGVLLTVDEHQLAAVAPSGRITGVIPAVFERVEDGAPVLTEVAVEHCVRFAWSKTDLPSVTIGNDAVFVVEQRDIEIGGGQTAAAMVTVGREARRN